MKRARSAVGTPEIAHACTNRFFLGVVLYEMLFDPPVSRVTDETGLLPVANHPPGTSGSTPRKAVGGLAREARFSRLSHTADAWVLVVT